MNNRSLISLLIIFISLASIAAEETQPQRGAKELFYDPGGVGVTAVDSESPLSDMDSRPGETSPRRTSAPSGISNQLGLSYWIELVETDGASGKRVTEQRDFRTGERIRLHFMSNCDGRIGLLLAGPSGKPRMLFPDPTKNLVDNTLRAGKERILPNADAWFRFDTNTGEERIFVVFAADQHQLDSTMSPEIQGGIAPVNGQSGSKDLVLEVDSENAGEVGTYAVNTAGQPIVLEIILRHV